MDRRVNLNDAKKLNSKYRVIEKYSVPYIVNWNKSNTGFNQSKKQTIFYKTVTQTVGSTM